MSAPGAGPAGAAATLALDRVGVGYGGRTVVDDATLTVPAGKALVVLGPSGCGKSSLLRAIAGIEPLAAGRVELAGADLAGVPTHRRGIGLMFQDHALFPHLSVAANVGYGLRMAKWDKDPARERVQDLLEAVGLTDRGGESVARLSGGEQQRVALARTLAPRPPVVLLDEPLGSLDRALRRGLLITMADMFGRDGTTVVYVTHDHAEAFELADEVAVMRAGVIVQLATPAQLWTRPASAWVARFLGMTNILSLAEASALLGHRREVGEARSRGDVVLLRPDAISLSRDPSSAGTGVQVQVVSTAFRGESTIVTFRAAESQAGQRSPAVPNLEVWNPEPDLVRNIRSGDLLELRVPAGSVQVLPE
ncbi:MAG: ABC transporter ATP-binding protein [Candidatus Nanopelagicales bacterium]